MPALDPILLSISLNTSRRRVFHGLLTHDGHPQLERYGNDGLKMLIKVGHQALCRRSKSHLEAALLHPRTRIAECSSQLLVPRAALRTAADVLVGLLLHCNMRPPECTVKSKVMGLPQ